MMRGEGHTELVSGKGFPLHEEALSFLQSISVREIDQLCEVWVCSILGDTVYMLRGLASFQTYKITTSGTNMFTTSIWIPSSSDDKSILYMQYFFKQIA